MATTDAAFLAEVENFLTSCHLPGISSLSFDRVDLNGPSLSRTAPVVYDVSTQRQEARSQSTHPNDGAAKLELAKAQDRKRRAQYRKRRQIERASLLHEVEGLTVELTKQQRASLSMSAVTWKLLAQHQLAARQSSEALHTQLREAVNAQTTVLRDFQRLMEDRLNSTTENLLSDCQHKRLRAEPSDNGIFAALILELDAAFAKTDEKLRAYGLESAEENWDDPSEEWVDGTESEFHRFRGKITLPIDYAKLCRYRWYASQLFHRQQGREFYQEVDDPDNTLAFKYRVSARLDSGKTATALQRFVVRRYEENGRTVLVWRIYTEGEGAFIGMHSDETGWGVATPTLNQSRVGTVIRSCVHNAPLHVDKLAPVAKQFNDKLLEWGLENNMETTIGLEKLVIQ